MSLIKHISRRICFLTKFLCHVLLRWNSPGMGTKVFQISWIIIKLSEIDIQPSSELFELLIQMSNLFIHVTNFKITITHLNSKFCIYYLKPWHFLNNWVSNFLEERSSTICASSPYNLGMKNWNQEVRSGVSYYTTFHKT